MISDYYLLVFMAFTSNPSDAGPPPITKTSTVRCSEAPDAPVTFGGTFCW